MLNFELDNQEEFLAVIKDTYLSVAQLGALAKLINVDSDSINEDILDMYTKFIS